MIVVTPPTPLSSISRGAGIERRFNMMCARYIFLAGSIEMGTAKDWQKTMIDSFRTHHKQDDFVILNPRRADWDPGWEQSMENPKFVEQVEWELRGLETADLIVFYFQPNTLSPISMMELGLHATSGKVMVCCPPGFHRKANIDITCRYYGVPVYDDEEGFVKAVHHALDII